MTKPFSHRGKETGSTPFGDRLKQECIRRGFGVHEFAKRCGIGVSQVTAFENRGVKPKYDTFIALAQTLDCSLDWLAGIE